MTTSTAGMVPTINGNGTDSGTDKAKNRARRARASGSEEDSSCTRYFLGRANADGSTPALDREVASEGEALVEALRSGVTYYAIQEFRVIPDFASKRPQLKKEVIHGK